MSHARIAIVGLALLAAACSSGKTTGEAQPGGTNESPASTSSAPAGDSKLASVKPCELISASEAGDLNIKSPEPRQSLGAETCEWDGVGNGGLTIAVEPKQGADSFNYEGAVKTPSKFGTYDGFVVPAPDKTVYACSVVISISKTSSVQIIASAGAATTDTAKACDMAKKSAAFAAGKLS
ncbi:hypothetical protein GCM10011609_68240 [Lentzea pudingi]|uniref:DUF3558 domain-containing protein n=1 Tax=Lentzea pudingi TaxID=1789439 RepID=A0ABQ2IPK8_9PSEU|nr:DUF3558 family protein [Lentzea pudingi]GGN17658.1 hypothetical protein GCM10011609_68240 [Lentzea pudingi]